jgi:protein SCO1/2
MASLRDPRRTTAALLALVALTATFVLSACGSSDGTAATTTESNQIEGVVRPDPLQVGDLSLPQVAPDGTETPFTFKADDGKLLFVAFGYTNCPDVCPTTLYDIKKARKQLGSDGDRIQVAFATVDPERDTPEVINQYLGSFAKDGHPLRTTDPKALTTAEDGFGVTSSVVKNADGTTDVSHTARSYVVDDQGNVVVEWAFGSGADVMANDLKLLLAKQDKSS